MIITCTNSAIAFKWYKTYSSQLNILCKIKKVHDAITALYLFNGPLSEIIWVSQYQKGKTNLESPEQETVSDSSISWAICKSAPRHRQITMPAPHHSIF